MGIGAMFLRVIAGLCFHGARYMYVLSRIGQVLIMLAGKGELWWVVSDGAQD